MAKPILLSILTALALFAIFLGVMRTGSASATFVGTVRFKDSTAATATDISLATIGQQVAVHVDDEDLIAPTSSVAVFSTSDPSGLTLTLNKIAEGKYSGLLQIATSTSATSTPPKLKAANGDTVTAVYHDVDPLISTAVIITVGEVATPPTPTPTPTPAPPPPPPGGGGGGGGDPPPVAEFTVDSTADAVDAAPGDGVCDDGDGNCTLRAAIMEANALAGAKTITLPAGTYTLTLTGASEDNNATGDLDIKSNVTIDGAGAPTTFINGGGIDRVLHILDGSTVNLNDLTITNGNGGIGGGIFNAGGTLLRVNRSSITGNTANQGAGINAFGSLFLTDSTVSGNTGGGIYVSGGVTVKLANCTISGNTLTRGSGAAIWLTHFGINLSLNNCTITGNTVISGAVGGIYAIVGTVNIKNTIVAGNAGGSKPDVEGTFNSQGYNLVGDGTGSSGFTATGDQVGTAASPIDPKLSPLADNGGPTETRALLPGSPAIDTGNAAIPGSGGNACEATDQRGVGRPQGSTCDIGAFEVEVTPGGLVVNSTADAVDATPGDGVCDDGAGNCTLRAAIMEANALAGADTITLPTGTYTLAVPGAGEDAALTGDLDITDDLTINGAGAATTVIDGGGIDRVFHILAGSTVDISGVTIQNGDTAGIGGGIFNGPGGTLTLNNTTLSSNSGDQGGGAVLNSGTMTIKNSTVSDNNGGTKQGGGVYNSRGTLYLINSTISANTAGGAAGIFNFCDVFGCGTVTLTNSTVSGNTGTGNIAGGGMFNSGTMTLINSTVTGNTASSGGGGGGGIFSFSGSNSQTILKNSIVAGNSASSGPDCNGPLDSRGFNLVQNTTDCTIGGDATGNITGQDPMLGNLVDNGGPTLTHALLNGSPAIDAVPVGDCIDLASNPITIDQRGVPRPQGPACDIGAFELKLVPTQADLSVTKSDSPDPVVVGELLTYSLTTANAATSTLAATGVTLTDSLATSTAFVSASAGCVYDAGPHTVACDIGNLGVSAFASTTIVVMPTAVGVITNTAEVAGNELDLNPANNTATQDTLVVQAPTVNEIVNGDFETGGFQVWTQINSGSGEFAINDGTFDPPGPDGPLPPLEGNFAAVTSQSGPGRHTLFQDVALSADLTIAVLSWDDRIRNHAGVFSDPNQEFRVEIWNTNNEVLAEIFSTNPGDASLNDRVTRAFDISTFIGQTIRIAFTQEDNLFFFNLHLDNVSLAVSTGVCGDLNGDGDVNVFDAIIDLQIIVGLIEPTQAQMILGDVVRDGTINVFDAILLLQHIVGLTVITHCGPEPATATNTSLAPQQPVPLALDERDSYPIADGS